MRIPLAFCMILFAAACNSKEEEAVSENDVDAARNFISAVLHSDFDKATAYMVPDSLNQEYLDITRRSFERKSPDEKRYYSEASINIHGIRQVSDSATVVHYSNSFKKIKDSLKVVKLNDRWLIDLKYSFPANNKAE